jgi:serpin B
MKTIVSLFVSALLLTSCAGILTSCTEPDVNTTAGDIPLKVGMEKKVAQDNDFSFDLLRQTIAHNGEPNVFISPLSMSIALGMVRNGAAGATLQEIEQALHLSGMSNDEINEYYKIMREGLLSVDPKTKLNIANSIWYRTGFPVKVGFLNVNKNYFNAEVRALDFTDPGAVDVINGWCAKATNNLIKKPLDRISADAMLYLINAIYFKGIWVKQFDPKKTYKTDFLAENGSRTQVDMMVQKDTFLYAEDEKAQYLDMPYGNKAFSITVVLPKDGLTTGQLLEDLSASEFTAIYNSLQKQEVNVFFPKFKMENKYEMKDPMGALGMQLAFTDEADFSPISDIKLLISRIIHSTYVEVDEVGTEAAAVTIVEFETTSMPVTPFFVANKPFIFLIREKSTGVILFAGKKGN